jgi:predicted enzyme related to lactoylglutathione lyase
MGNPVVHFEVIGKDAEALQSFYTDAFDWQMEPTIPGYSMAYPGAQDGINGGVGATAPDGSTRATSPST